MILHDPKRKEDIKKILADGKLTEFWLLLIEALDDSIAHLQGVQDGDDVKQLPPDEYKVQVEILKAKKANLIKLKELPDTLGQWLDEPDQTEPNFDPYYTAEELAEKEGG